jgi:murein DD-endopeptidase MepM/ murein hydrolase activator NlpD
LTRDEAIVAVDQIFPGGTTIGGGGAGGGAGTGGGIDDTVKKNLVTDLITSDESPFGGSTKEQVSQLYNRFSTVNDEQFDDYKKYQEAHKKLAKENSEYQNARAAKAYGVQKAESDLAIAKKTAVEKSQKHEQSLHDFYFAETATGDKGMPNFKPKGVFYRMQDEIDNQIASLRATSRVDLWDFSDDDSWLGVNWKKTALAVAGLAAMGGQIGLSVGLKGMPNFVGPLLMKAIDADVSSQKTNIAEARMKAAGVGSLFGTLMDGYGKARDAIAHATKGGYQVAAAILESTKAMPLTTDQKKGIDWILQEVKKADSEAAMKTRTGIMSGIKDETAMAVDMEMKSQSLQNLETQEDATKINALVALEGHYSKLSGKALELPADEQKKLSAGFEAIDTIRDIKRMASDLLNEDLGDIEKMGYILIKDFRKQFSDEDDVINKLNNLIKSQKNFVYQLAKVNDPRVSNADFENTEKIAGSPEEESIFSFITGLYNIEYAVKQATLSRLTPVYGTKSFNQYAPRMRISFGQDEAAVMQNFVNSAMAREQASAVPAGQTPSAQQSEAALKRLDVGMNAVRATKYPDLDDMIYKQFLSSQLSSKAAQKILQVRGKTPAQRKEGYAALAAPVGGGITVTSYQGERTSPGGIGSTNHGGIDIKAAVGDPVYSITDGTVVAVIKGKAGWGNYVQVRDLNGNLHLYAHGSNVDYFKKNDKVYAGQQIMAAGKSGTATGPHLHYEVKSSRGSYLPALAFISGHKWVHEDDAKDHKH